MCINVVQPGSFVGVFETLLSYAATTVDVAAGQARADFYVTCILSSLPWGGAALVEVFTLSHPNFSNNKNNQRYKKMHFELPSDAGSAMLHGFAGYFNSVLYKDVHLGIEPTTATPNMFSWFPVFFPPKTPIYLPSGPSIEAHFWHCCGPTKLHFQP